MKLEGNWSIVALSKFFTDIYNNNNERLYEHQIITNMTLFS